MTAPPGLSDGIDLIDLIGVWTVAAFAAYAIGDGNDWNRYNFALPVSWELSTHPLDPDWGIAVLASTSTQLLRP